MVRIAVLTSSRADFGVYLPLLKCMQTDSEINLEIIAFGTHLSKFHGYTINDILNNGFRIKHALPTVLADDSEEGISTSTALGSMKFSSFWELHKNDFDLVFCLGDRYEMYAAVSAGVPYGIKFAHLYGGDITIGAIDNVYRDCITIMSSIHFTSTIKCAARVKALKGDIEPVNVVGILSLDDMSNLELLTSDKFKDKWNIDLTKSTILITFHPETIQPEMNQQFANVIYDTCVKLSKRFQLVITMPNADTEGYLYRQKYYELKEFYPDNIFLVENFGITSYFTCMKYCTLMLGNTSSGISEAATFNKYFINVGNRQKGREIGDNVFNSDFDSKNIISLVNQIMKNNVYKGTNIYLREGSVKKIIQIIKEILYAIS